MLPITLWTENSCHTPGKGAHKIRLETVICFLNENWHLEDGAELYPTGGHCCVRKDAHVCARAHTTHTHTHTHTHTRVQLVRLTSPSSPPNRCSAPWRRKVSSWMDRAGLPHFLCSARITLFPYPSGGDSFHCHWKVSRNLVK